MNQVVADRAFQLLETKVIRRVRTEAGVRRFKQPIGSIIINDGLLVGLTEIGNNPKTGVSVMEGANGKKYNIRLEPRGSGRYGKHYVGREGTTPGKGREVFASLSELEVLAEIGREVQTEAGIDTSQHALPGSSSKREPNTWSANQVAAASDEISMAGNGVSDNISGDLGYELWNIAGRLDQHGDIRVARHELEQMKKKHGDLEGYMDYALEGAISEGKLPKRYDENVETEYAVGAGARAAERASKPTPVKTGDLSTGMWVRSVDKDGKPKGDWFKITDIGEQSMRVGASRLLTGTDRNGKKVRLYRQSPRDKWETIGDPEGQPTYEQIKPEKPYAIKKVHNLSKGDRISWDGKDAFVQDYIPDKDDYSTPERKKNPVYKIAVADDEAGKINSRKITVPRGTQFGPPVSGDDDSTSVPLTFTKMKSEYPGYEKLKLANGNIVYTDADDETTDVYDENDNMLGNFQNGSDLHTALNSMGASNFTAKTPRGYDSARHPNLSEADSEYEDYDKFVGKDGTAFYVTQEDSMTVAYDKNDKEIGRSADRQQLLDDLNERYVTREVPKEAPAQAAPLKRLKSKFDGWKRFKMADGRVVDTGQAVDDDNRWYATGKGGWDEIIADGDTEDEMMAKLRIVATPADTPVSFSPGNTDVVPKRSTSPIAGMTREQYDAAKKRVTSTTRDAILGTRAPSRGRGSSGSAGAFDRVKPGDVLPQSDDEQLRQDEREQRVIENSSPESRIRDVYRELSKGSASLVKLSELRERMTDMPRAEQDAALRRLMESDDVRIEPEPLSSRLTQADRNSAINIGGEDRHLLQIAGKPNVEGFMPNEVAASVIGQEADYNEGINVGSKWSDGAITRAREIRDRLRDGTIDTPEAVRRLNVAADALREGPVSNDYSAAQLRQLGVRLSNYDNRSAAEIREAAKAKRVETLRAARDAAARVNQAAKDVPVVAAPSTPQRTPKQEALTPDTSGERASVPKGSQLHELERDPNTVYRNGRVLKDADAQLLNLEGNNGLAQNRLKQPANRNLNDRLSRLTSEDREAFTALQDRATENYLNGMTHAAAWKEAIETAEKIKVADHYVQQRGTRDGRGEYAVVRLLPGGGSEEVTVIRPKTTDRGGYQASQAAKGRMFRENIEARRAATRRVPLSGPVGDTPTPESPAVTTTAGVTDPAARSAELQGNIRIAYDQLLTSEEGWVSLRRLRPALDAQGYTRAEQNEALRLISRQPGVNLIPESNGKAMTAEDRAAAVNIGAQDKHLINFHADGSTPKPNPRSVDPTVNPLANPLRSHVGAVMGGQALDAMTFEERVENLRPYLTQGPEFVRAASEGVLYAQRKQKRGLDYDLDLTEAEVGAGLRPRDDVGEKRRASTEADMAWQRESNKRDANKGVVPRAEESIVNEAKTITEKDARFMARVDPQRFLRVVAERYFRPDGDFKNMNERKAYDELNHYADMLKAASTLPALDGTVQSILMQMRVGHAGMMGTSRTMMTIRKVLNEEYGQ